MKLVLLVIANLIASTTFASSDCYELSKDGKVWDAEPFKLCVERNGSPESEYILTLSKLEKKVAVYYLNSLPSAADSKSYGFSAYRGSMVDDSVSISIGYGEVHIGDGTYFYKED